MVGSVHQDKFVPIKSWLLRASKARQDRENGGNQRITTMDKKHLKRQCNRAVRRRAELDE